MNRYIRLILCCLLVLCVFLSGCSKNERIESDEYIDLIIEACTNPDNTFPSDRLLVEFLEYEYPASNQNSFHYTFRFKNISGQSLNTNILGFYDPASSEFFTPLHTGIQPAESKPLTLKHGEGWSFDIHHALENDWNSYSNKEQKEITAYGKHLYFYITLEENTYCCILDFENEKVITVQ